MPTLRTILGTGPLPFIRDTSNVRDASLEMAKFRKGLLVLDEDDELVGIVTPKDLLNRVVAKSKPPELTAVASVMTPNPDCVSPDLTPLDALKDMYDHKYLHLPVRETDEYGRPGAVVGLVDVMDLICSTARAQGGKGWRDFFDGAMHARGDNDDAQSDVSSLSDIQSLRPKNKAPEIRAHYLNDDNSDVFSLSLDRRAAGGIAGGPSFDAPGDIFDFKVKDQKGHFHKIRCAVEHFESLREQIAAKLGHQVPCQVVLKYLDEDQDEIVISSASSLSDAVDFARSTGASALKVNAYIDLSIEDPAMTATAAVAAEGMAMASGKTASAGGGNGGSEKSKDTARDTSLYAGLTAAAAAAVGVASFMFFRNNN